MQLAHLDRMVDLVLTAHPARMATPVAQAPLDLLANLAHPAILVR